MDGTGRWGAARRLLLAQADMIKATAEAWSERVDTVLVLHTPNQEVVFGETAVVITPGMARVILDGTADECRSIRSPEDLRAFCEDIIRDPRWSTRQSSGSSKPTG